MRKTIISIVGILTVAQIEWGVAYAGQAKVGELTCDVSAGIGAILGGQQAVDCVFNPSIPGADKLYHGQITRFGLDIGKIAGGTMQWLVYSANANDDTSIDGLYVGLSAEATLAVGLGANVLVGGSQKSLSLQPISVEEEKGFNIAVGVTELSLTSSD